MRLMTAQNGTTNPFTAEQYAMLEQMLADGKSWTEISAACGHTANSCSTTHGRRQKQAAVAAQLPAKSKGKLWDAEEVSRLRYLRDVLRWDFKAIGRDLGRTDASCNTKYNVITEGPTPVHGQPEQGMRVAVTPAALADRDARYQLRMQQSPIAALLGEPLPGRSALDQREKRSAAQ
jgi:hypothetical protein